MGLLDYYTLALLSTIVAILPSCNSQLFENQPYFRGILSLLPGNHNSEFEPLVEDTDNIDSNPVVSIRDGTLRGFTLRTVNGHAISAFQNIPYAEPPVGPLRFRDPVKNLPWNGIRNGTVRSSQCIQIDLTQLLRIHGEEDCLYLNIYSPRKGVTRPLPVMVFIHGGFFYFGAGSTFGPRYLLDSRNVILVTFNYRLGPFGFLSTGDDASPGNQGLKDQVLALKWVQENIAAFGGDPNSVTVFAQSAGATSVGLHILSPASRGLFHRVIQSSGSAFCLLDEFGNASETTQRVAELFKCRSESTQTIVDCLRKIPARALAPVQLKFAKFLMFPMLWFGPTVEHNHPGAFLTKHPKQAYENGEAANVTMISGLTSDELSFLVSAVFKMPVLLEQVNNKWDRVVGPNILDLPRNHSEEANAVEARKIWNFYMGSGRQLSWDNRLVASRMLSDKYFNRCTLEGMRYHSMYTNQSVYGYIFSYRGRYSSVQQVGGKPQNWGVAHSDELIYLLNNPDYYPSLKQGDPEMKMSQMMTSLWTSFAISDRPCISATGGIGSKTDSCELWKPIQPVKSLLAPLQFLNLTLVPKMIADPYVQQYNF